MRGTQPASPRGLLRDGAPLRERDPGDLRPPRRDRDARHAVRPSGRLGHGYRGDRPRRQRERERRALAELAFEPDAPAVELDEALREREPETRAFARAIGRLAELAEFLEDLRLILRRDADAGVAHAHLDLITVAA